ncbi:MAG: hypothetical protein AAFW89_11225 [Bacteroidota bacterium]
MKLISTSKSEPEVDTLVHSIDIKDGPGTFWMEGGYDKNKTIAIHYYKPMSFNQGSRVLLVIPGAGRNGDDYRDAWIELSEQYNLLVLSPEYSEQHYPGFWSYNLGGMIDNVDVQKQTFSINHDASQWIFGDFDRVFDAVKTELNLTSYRYDLFGHSAGGQLLHRLAIFEPESKADRILASNAGWYTVPSLSESFPYGLLSLHETAKELNFGANLILFLGEKDDENETRGHLRRSPEVDKQGLHRLERGIYFYHQSKKIAADSNLTFNWKLEIVPNVGHDYRLMSKKAGEYLYGAEKK